MGRHRNSECGNDANSQFGNDTNSQFIIHNSQWVLHRRQGLTIGGCGGRGFCFVSADFRRFLKPFLSADYADYADFR
jgi:hypothetical protein